jgi:small-conductance mechanosensitive channel
VQVQIGDVPPGAEASIVLRSGTFERVVTSSRTVDSLPAGTYEVIAMPITTRDTVFDGDPARQVITISPSQSSPRINIRFRPRGGVLVLEATGLPSWARGAIRITGPAGFTRNALTGDTISGLAAGTYTIVADRVETTDGRFEAIPSARTATLSMMSREFISFAYGVARAALTVSIDGLPRGSAAGVTVSGPAGFSRTVDSTTTISGVAAGLYTARAARVRIGGFSYEPDATTRDATISGTQQRALGFAFTLATGAIAIGANGLPEGATPRFTITSTDGFSRTVDGAQTLIDLEPGSYRVQAASVVANGLTYTPSQAELNLEVDASLVAAPALFTYASAAAALELDIVGLPATANAAVRLTGPNGQVRTVDRTTRLDALAPGTWRLDATSVSADGDTFDPEVTSRQLTLRVSETNSTQLRFQSRTGALAISIIGLPTGANGAVRITGPNGFDRTISATTTLSGLAVGTYTLTAASVTVDTRLYSVSPATSSVSVTRGVTTSRTISYSGSATALAIEVAGLPAGVAPSVNVTGPGGFARTLNDAAVLDGLAAGTYRITASRVVGGDAAFDPTPSSLDVNVTTGQRRSESIVYALATGSLAVSVSGLPAGVNGNVTVTGPAGFTRTITQSTTLSMLAPGTYTIAAATVSTTSGTLTPTPTSRSVIVTASPTPVSALVSYATTLGAMNLTLSGLPASVANAVTLVGPGGATVSRSQSGIVTGLAAGVWEVRGNTVTVNGERYTGAPATQSVTVSASDTVNATVGFTRVTARLTITVAGLPAGLPGDVTVTGPSGFTRTVGSTQTIIGLEPGTYTIASDPVTQGSTQYLPSVTSEQVTLTAGSSTSRTVTYTGNTTALSVAISGLPAGTGAAVTVTGPGGFSSSLSASGTLVDLAAGTYTVAAANVTGGGYTWGATPASQALALTAGQSRTATLVYAAVTGRLTVTVSGLPAGVAAAITVTGPGGFSQAVTTGTTIANLAPGSYTVAASNVTQGGTLFAPSSASQTVTVTAGATASRSVTYSGTGTSLAVTVNGLPAGTNGNVTVTGPGGYSQAVTATTTLSGLAPGTYTVAGASVSAGGFTYGATPASQTVSLAAGENKAATVAYAATTGQLTLAVSGLPAGVNASISVTGPGAFSQSVTAGTTLSNLTPGTYTIAASNVTQGGTLFTPSPASQTVSVTAGATASRSVGYTGTGTSLAVTLNGLPAGVNGNVTVTGPGGFTRAVTSTTSITGLAAGTYTVAGATVSSGGFTYGATPASQSVTLAAGENKSATVTYAATTGRLTLTVGGLPAGASAAITVTGPGGFTQSVTAGTTLSTLTPGTYTIASANVTAGGSTYAPAAASQTATVSAGATASASVTYSVTGGGGGGGGGGASGPNLVLDGAYITQAIQNMAGSARLVAGREAFLRVFVTAASSNTLTPRVRVRLFEGATNFRTFEINAPSTSVPTALAEGTLTSTWNATLTTSDMRPNLRIQVDVDPSNAVAEPDETDNVWPRTGTQPIDVATVAPFNIVFVPVRQSVNGLQGDVTTANLESRYLSMTRQIFPLNQINASVRAVYTTNAAALQSNDGNGAWLTILSEMNMLRNQEASPANYYGVVKVSYGGGVAGYGYVPGRAAVGWDASGSSLRVTAHELGHNFGRRHVAACGSGNTDAAYPYASGLIGGWGWNPSTGAIVSNTTTDIMGYCSNQWVSDYTWNAVFTYRASLPAVVQAFGAAQQSTLMVWGRIVDGVVTLEPAMRQVGRAVMPERAGRYRVELRDASGRVLTGFSFAPDAIDHAPNAGTFGFAIPLDAYTETHLASVAVTGGVGGEAEVAPSQAMALAMASGSASVALTTADGGVATVTEPAARVQPAGAESRVVWDDAAWPRAIVRDAATGQVLAYLRRSGDAFVPSGSQIKVTFSNGLRSLTKTLPSR